MPDVALPVDRFTTPGGAKSTMLTAFMQTLLDDPDAATALVTLGIASVYATLTGTETLTHKTLTDPVLNGTITGTGQASAATASVLAARDANGLLLANAFAPALNSTVTDTSTLTLTAASKQIQVFTGTTTHIVSLPGSGMTLGQSFLLINQSTGNVTVNLSGGGNLFTLAPGVAADLVALSATPTASGNWHFLRRYIMAYTNTASTAVLRDGSSDIYCSNIITGASSVTTNAGTTTLSAGSQRNTIFTGSTTHTVKMPTTTVVTGWQQTVYNTSSGAVTVQSSGAETIATLTTGQSLTIMALADTPTTAAHWGIIGKNY